MLVPNWTEHGRRITTATAPSRRRRWAIPDSPIPASSGKTNRYRLNRGGDRQANAALHAVCLVRMQRDPRTRAYVVRRTAEGLSKKDIMRCLKRYIASDLYRGISKIIKGLDRT